MARTVPRGERGRQTLSVSEYLDLMDIERLEEARQLDMEGYEDAPVGPAMAILKAPVSLWDEIEAAKMYPVKIWREVSPRAISHPPLTHLVTDKTRPRVPASITS